jgi:hypothetical protein
MNFLSSGWGPPPAEICRRADYITNGSRITRWRNCNQAGQLAFIELVKKRKLEGEDHYGALYFGSAWHDAMDRIFRGESAAEIIAEFHVRNWEKPAEQLMFEQGLGAYWHHYGGKPANGTLLASEQSFWALIEVGGATFLCLGTFDRLCTRQGYLINGEIKTVDPRRKFDVWLTMRANSFQDAFYNYSLVRLPKTLPSGVTLPESVLGTVYDIFFKKSYPNRKVKTDSAVEKLRWEQAGWADGRFRTIQLTHIDSRAEAIIERELMDHADDRRSSSQNHNACYGFAICEFYDHCHRGAPLESTLFQKRDTDYVQRAEALAESTPVE